MPTAKPKISIVLSPEIAQELELAAARQGRTKSNLAAWVVEQYLRGNIILMGDTK